ncbi:MAG: TonB C-terminal domain-containing protein [Verrucomicrobia bacterium]|nr:TonB C-terminal domain-containing protein [Verrucomicrobiota bacterium]
MVKPPVKKPDTKPVKPADKPKPVPEPRPAPEPPKPAPKKPEIALDLNKVVVRNPADTQERKRKEKEAADRRAQEKAEREALEKWNREVQARRDGLAASAKNSSALLGTGFASDKGVKIEVGGPGGAAYANYLAVVRKHYDSAWRLSPSLGDQDQTAEVSVTILRSGEILNARISKRSGNAALDKSVESALAQVRRLPPFPETSTDAQRTVTILFNLKAKRSSG